MSDKILAHAVPGHEPASDTQAEKAWAEGWKAAHAAWFDGVGEGADLFGKPVERGFRAGYTAATAERAPFDAEIARLRKWQNSAMELLGDLSLHFDESADADQPSGCDYPIPNDAMRFLMRCDALSASAKVDASITLRAALAASVALETAR